VTFGYCGGPTFLETPSLLPSSVTDQPATSRALRPRARLLRTLGADLISSEKVALIELVKNSFDADATSVVIRFQGPLKPGEGSIEIWDDGHGMTVQTVQTSWLDIATDVKKNRIRSESGSRRVLGEKGIGRLASARLASEMLLTTRRAGSDEVRLLIDWRDFDRPNAYLDEIDVAWEVGSPSVFADGGPADGVFAEASDGTWQRGQGTMLQLDKLVREWKASDFDDLRTALSRLVRPLPERVPPASIEQFRIVLVLPAEFEPYSGEVGSPEALRSPHYRLSGTVEDSGLAQLKYSQLDPSDEEVWANQPLWERRDRGPRTGPFELDIEVWDRDTDALRKVSGKNSLVDFRRLLDEMAGVSVYRDGFRVLPFGEVGDDWLGLDRRRVQNPTMRVSNNQVIGHVFISADTNSELRDQTNREGLLEGAAYEDLRELIRSALALVEKKRYVARRANTKPTATRGGLFKRFELGEIRRALVAQYPGDTRLIGLIDAKSDEIRSGIEEVQRVLSQYSRLATLGSLIDRVLHDGRTAVTQLKSIVRFGHRDMANPKFTVDEKLDISMNSLDRTSVQAELLSTLFSQIEPFSGRKRGRPKVLSLRKIVDDALSLFESDAANLGAILSVEGEDADVSADPSEIITAIVNLVQNSLYWLSKTDDDRRLLVRIKRLSDGSVTMLISDSGPGVPDEARDFIFEPYFSSKPDGVGLGLSIAGSIIQEFYSGELILVDGGPLPGATFQVTLRRRV
jgi:signal transduction histidine kinase